MTEELGSIGVKLRVDLSDLDRAETAAKRKISGIAREHQVTFKVRDINVTEVQKQLRAIAQGKLDVKVGVSLPANAGRLLRTQLQTQLKAAGPVKVAVTADLSEAEIRKIKTAVGKAGIRLGGPASGGAGGAAATVSPSAPLTPHERKVATTQATETAKAIKGTTTTPAPARSAPAKPVAAASAAAPAAAPGQSAAALAKQVAELEQAVASLTKATAAGTEAAKKTAAPKAAPAPKATPAAPKATPAAPASRGPGLDKPLTNFGTLPTGPAVGVSYRTNPDTGRREVQPQSTKGVLRRLGRSSQRAEATGTSVDSLKRDKMHTRAPETPEEIEYASRPTQAQAILTPDELEEMDASSHGVRGASRSGARRRGEPVLTPLERQVKDTIAREGSATQARARDAETRAPARKSGAFYGSGEISPSFKREVSKLQMLKFDPALRTAFDALNEGDLGAARSALRGFSSSLAGADPRKRRKFFKLFRDVENAPPEILEKHAALQALFTEIGNEDARRRVAATEAELKPYRTGKGGKALRDANPDKYREVSEAAVSARKWQMDLLRGLTRRGTGGGVRGAFPRARYDSSLDSMFADKRTQKGLDRFKKDFPISAGKIAEIRDISGLHEDKGGNAQAMDGGYALGFNERYIRDSLKRGKGNSLAHRSGQINDVVQHELGHVVDMESGRIQSGFAGKAVSGYGAESQGENAAELFTQRSGLGGFLTRRRHGIYFETLKDQSRIEQRNFKEQEERRAMLAARLQGRAGGGPVGGGLMARIAAAKAAKDAYLVAETRDETFLGDSGKVEILKQPSHIRTFEEPGKVLPYVPEWVRRGVAKDLTGQRATGGPVHAARYSRIGKLLPRALARTDRRWEASADIMRRNRAAGIQNDPNSDERVASDRLASQADTLRAQLSSAYDDAFYGRGKRAVGGPVHAGVGGNQRGALLGRITARREEEARRLAEPQRRYDRYAQRYQATTYDPAPREPEPPEEVVAPSPTPIRGLGGTGLRARLAAAGEGRLAADEMRFRAEQADRLRNEAGRPAPIASGTGFTLVSPTDSPTATTAAGRGFVLGESGPVVSPRPLRGVGSARDTQAAYEASSAIHGATLRGSSAAGPLDGGPAPLYKPDPSFKGQLAAEPGSGLAGKKKIREEFEGERSAIAAGKLSSSGGVQRVFVVNWPAGGGFGKGGIGSQPRDGSIAAGPLRFASDKDAEQFANTLGGHIGQQLNDILGNTKPVKAEKDDSALTGGTSLNPFERQQARLEARGAAAPLTAKVLEATSRTSEAQQLIPVRSLSVAIGQIFSTVFGGRGDALTRAKQANALAAQAKTAISNFTSEQEKLKNVSNQLRTAQDPRSQTELIKRVQEQAKATRLARTEAERLVTASDAASKSVITQAGAVQNLAAGTVGVVGGTLLFSTALGVAQAGISAISEVLGPVIQRMSGFQSQSAAVTASLAEQTRAQGGAVRAAVATAEAQAGLSSATAASISPLIERRVQIEAGNKALIDAIGLLHTFENTQQGSKGAAGLTRTQGGLFGTSLQGVPSTSELVANELATVPKPEDTARSSAAVDKLQQEFDALTPEQQQGHRGQSIKKGLDYQKSLITPGSAEPGGIGVSDTRIKFFNDAIEKGGGKLRILAQSSLPDLDDSTRELAAKAADAAGAFDFGNNIRDKRAIIVDSLGRVAIKADDVTKTLSALNEGLTVPDVGVLLKQLTERIIPAQLASFRAQSNLQRGVVNPAQFALGEAAAPTPGLTIPGATSQIPFEAGLVGKGDVQAKKVAATVKGEIGGAVTFVNDQIQKGHDALVALVPADLRTEFQGVLADITATGQQIAGIQANLSQQQADLAIKEYNNQLRIARRSLQDAKDLQAGIRGEVKQTVGGLEGQNIALQRQLQLLGFELQQRQINFRLATAGFVAPGTTPEERAARIEAAKAEAAFAQKQLDIQKQLANNQFKSLTLPGVGEVARQITDLNRQIDLLERGRTLTVNTAVYSKALDILNKKQALLVEQAGTYIEEGLKITQAAIEGSAEAMKATGKGFNYILGETAKAWGVFGDQAKVVLDALRGTAPNSTRTSGGGSFGGSDHPGGGGAARGIVGDTLGPTELTVGEAAGEKVAVLKNPKLVPSSSLAGYGGAASGGSSAAPIQVNISVVVAGDASKETADQLAARIAKQVEETLMRKTSLFGLRRV